LPGHPFQAAGVQLELAVGVAVGLHPDAVVLVLRGAAAAQLGEHLGGAGQALREHRPDRVAGAYPDLLHRLRPTLGDRGGDQPDIRADVEGPLENRPGLAATGVHLREPVQDGGGADAQTQVPGHRTHEVARFQRCRLAQQPREQLQLAPLRPGPRRGGDLVQRVEHHRDLQAIGTIGAALGQQPLGRQAEVPGLPCRDQRLFRRHAGGRPDSPGGQPLGQADVHSGEVRCDLPLAQQRHRRQQLGRRLRDQPGDAVDHRQPGSRLLQIPISLGQRLVPHRHRPRAPPRTSDPSKHRRMTDR
jgi:hypothetical protein